MKKGILVMAFLSALMLYGSEDGKKHVVRTVADHGVQGVVVHYEINDFQSFRLTAAGVDFERISIEGFSFLHKEGYPALPSNRDIVLLPHGGATTVGVEVIRADTLQGIKVWPAQPLQPDGYSLEETFPGTAEDQPRGNGDAFVYDSLFYDRDQYYPQQIVSLDQQQHLRDNPVGIVHVTPFQYNPAKQELVVIREVKYTLAFSGAERFFDDISRHSQGYLKTLPQKFINHESIGEEMRGYLSGGVRSSQVDYLIVAHQMFSMAADTLAQWKRQLGHGVHIMKRSHWTTAQVKDSIHSFYHGAATYPDFFVILGDQEHVPAELVHVGRNRYSDHYYACMGPPGDYFPDMARGRISAKSSEEALSTVRKIISY